MRPGRYRFLTVVLAAALVSSCSSSPVTNNQAENTNRMPPGKTLTIAAVGDIMLDGTAREFMQKNGYDYAFEKMRPWLTRADIAFGNLEGPLTTRGTPATDKKYLFRSPPAKVASALKWAGFDVMSLANNHSLDYGKDGLDDTIAALDNEGISHVGAGDDLSIARRAAYLQRNGLKVAFLAYSLTFPEEFWATDSNAGTVFGNKEIVEADIRKAKSQADIVVASFHWGQESHTDLRPYQVALGHAAIDAGASLVIGHHPHILQAVEKYKHGVILYSMGNFAFGSYSQIAKVSALAEISFSGNKITKVQLVPINVNNVSVLFQTQPLQGNAAVKVVTQLQEMSEQLGTRLNLVNNLATLEMEAPINTASK